MFLMPIDVTECNITTKYQPIADGQLSTHNSQLDIMPLIELGLGFSYSQKLDLHPHHNCHVSLLVQLGNLYRY